jgi:hypothetical protein
VFKPPFSRGGHASQSPPCCRCCSNVKREMCSYLKWLLHIEAPGYSLNTSRRNTASNCRPNPPQCVSTPAGAAPVAAPAPVTPSNRWPLTAPTQYYPSPTSSPPTPSRFNQSSPGTSDEECLTPLSGDNQVVRASGLLLSGRTDDGNDDKK